MKRIVSLILLLSVLFSCKKDQTSGSLNAKWKPLVGLDSAIYAAVSYSVDGKGYVITGSNHIYDFDIYGNYPGTSSGTTFSGLIRYDTVTKTWQRLPDFPGGARVSATGFSIGKKIYFGTGIGVAYYADFWQFDTETNVWTRLGDFPGGARAHAASFTVGGKGYITTGQNASTVFADIYEYDPAGDGWKKMADFPGSPRADATGFSIGNAGYLCGGIYSLHGLWQFTPSSNTWTEKTGIPARFLYDFDGVKYMDTAYGASGTAAVVLKDKAVVGFGFVPGFGLNDHYYNDVWEYDATRDVWRNLPPLMAQTGASGRTEAFGFVIGDQAYFGGGYWETHKGNHQTTRNAHSDFYQFSF